MKNLSNQIREITKESICDSKVTYTRFIDRLSQGLLTRDENPKTHYCAYFLPFDSTNKKVFIVHHKKANKWLAPGGHIDKGEDLLNTLNREINEELGVKNFFSNLPSSFLLTITPIENETQPCKEHLDIWFLMETNGSNFNVDPREFHETRWLSIEEALEIVTDPPNRKALEYLKNK